MTSGVVTNEDVGAWIKAALAPMGWTQIDLGRALTQRTGDPTWSSHKAVKVSKVIKGKQDLTAAELSIVADIQGQEITWYYQPRPPYTEPPQAPNGPKGLFDHPQRVASITPLHKRVRLQPVGELAA